MNTKLLLLGCGLLATSQAFAGTFELNNVRGLWRMDGSLVSHWASQQPLTTQGLAEPPYQSSGGSTWLALASATAPFGGLKPTERLVAPNSAGPNGPVGATLTNSWTLVVDVRFPAFTTWTSILQTDPGNSLDAAVFIGPARELRFIGASGPAGSLASDSLSANTWYRLAITAAYDSGSNQQILRAYINGTPTSQTAAGLTTSPPEARYALGTIFNLFSDNDNETAKVDVGNVAFWGLPLASADIATLGGGSTGVMTWADMIPSDGYPPLTGALKFGSFTAYFSPNQADLAAIAASARPPTLPGAVELVTVNLGVGGGTIAGHPQHTFGGEVDGQVMPNGDIVVDDDWVTLNYTPPAGAGVADVFTLANVTYSRFRTELTPTGARTTLAVYFPAGMGVAINPLSKQLYPKAEWLDAPLDADLLPSEFLNLDRPRFGSGNDPGLIYPMVDRVPVRFATWFITVATRTGEFTFEQDLSEDLVFHREPQIQAMLTQVGANLPGASVPASNDFYFVAARSVDSVVDIRARDDGSAALQAASIVLDPQKFGASDLTFITHYPKLSVTWADAGGSRLVIANGTIDPVQSGLAGASSTRMSYATGVPTKSCDTLSDPAVPTEQVEFYPHEGVWRFTPDGGLRAEGFIEAYIEDIGYWPLYVEWGRYPKGAAIYHTHQFKTPFEFGRLMTAGVATRDDDLLAGLADYQKPAALWLSGHGSPDNSALTERPGTPAYYDGLADYPGLNLRCASGSHAAVSRLADEAVPMGPDATYPLADEAKYCLRPSGVTGRHLADETAPEIDFPAFGATFHLSRLSLGYLEGVNVSSGVRGDLLTLPPAEFGLSFESLLFGGQGQLLGATVASPQPDKILGPSYWNLKFTPLALDFPQPAVCPAPDPGDGFVRVTAKAQLTAFGDSWLTGTIGVKDGQIVAENDLVAKGQKSISRFTPGGELQVTGPAPDLKPWRVNPTCGISLNKSSPDSGGTLTVAGLMDVPFFTDLPVVLSADSRNTEPRPPVYVRLPWEPLETATYDRDHRGIPVGTTLGDYRGAAGYDPHATRGWQNGINFDLPVHLEANHRFRSRTPVPDQPVLLFNLTEAVRTMTPDAAELTFEGEAKLAIGELIPQVNLGSLLTDSGLLGPLGGDLQAGLDGALGSVMGLDGLLADQIQSLIQPALEQVAAEATSPAFLANLASLSDRTGALDSLAPGLASDLQEASRASSTFSHSWVGECAGKIHQARTGLEAARSLLATAGSIKGLASAIGGVIGESGTPVEPDAFQLEAIQSLLDQVIAQLQTLESQLGGTGVLALTLEGNFPDPTTLVAQALGDLKAKWEAPNDAYGDGFLATATPADLAKDLAAALADRIAGSDFAGTFAELLRQYAADSQMLARQVIDDTLRMAEQLVAGAPGGPAIPALGSIGDTVAAARLRGYARINGDSLHELRLDGHGEFNLGGIDKMAIDTWFLMRDVDSSTPAGKCMANSGAKTEVVAGATGQLDWGEQSMGATLATRVCFDDTGSPNGFTGDLALSGDFSFGAVALKQINLGVGFGNNNSYVYGRASATTSEMGVTAGLFAGTTCDLGVVQNADRDIGAVLNSMPGLEDPPYMGAVIYAEGNVSLMPIIGIPPSCLLDLRLIGGEGMFAFMGTGGAAGSAVAGEKFMYGIEGELLCLADVTGSVATVLGASGDIGLFSGGMPSFTSVAGSAAGTLSAEVGVGFFSYTFEKTLRLNVQGTPSAIHWSVDY
ncbi:MAG: hypothetical protein NTW21_01540 [Verrucomicrobia bacterium]|nr:hypothetical protein [Verrucomicrobiota bacterium]